MLIRIGWAVLTLTQSTDSFSRSRKTIAEFLITIGRVSQRRLETLNWTDWLRNQS